MPKTKKTSKTKPEPSTREKGIREGLSIRTRAYTVTHKEKQEEQEKQPKKSYGEKKTTCEDLVLFGKRVLVFDTETTIDVTQKLLFGTCLIYDSGDSTKRIDEVDNPVLSNYILFHSDDINHEELAMLQDTAKRELLDGKQAIVMNHTEFINNVLLPEICIMGSVIVGFNLPFDISRIAVYVQTFSHGKHKDEFVFDLTRKTNDYRIAIQNLSSKSAFIKLADPRNTSLPSNFDKGLRGRFLDVRTLLWALYSKSYSLAKACEFYGIKEDAKQEIEEHGIITPEYIRYNIFDVRATFRVLVHAFQDFFKLPLSNRKGDPILPNKVYSAASVGKAYFRTMGITPFLEQNPNYPPDLLGKVMASYYGGRAECKYRRKPMLACHVDVQSMYPSVFTLSGLWDFVVADHIKYESNEKVLNETLEWLESITPETMLNPASFKKLNAICEVIPNKDLLPCKANYGGTSFNIALNYIDTNGHPMYFTLSDVVACKLLTGRTPEIKKVWRFTPVGKQKTLNPVNIMGDEQLRIDPAYGNFFKKVIEMRLPLKEKASHGDKTAKAQQLALKILANSTSYGVFVEMNREESENPVQVDVYGTNNFSVFTDQIEKPGTYFNPILGTLITGGARLILSLIERLVRDEGGIYAFTDTDSMCILDEKQNNSYQIGKTVVNKMKSLYPYEQKEWENKSLLGLEDVNFNQETWEYEPLYIIAISAKRYVFFRIKDGKIKIEKNTEHGLGYILPPYSKKAYKSDNPPVDGTEWYKDLWMFVIQQVLQDHPIEGFECPEPTYPSYADLPILGQLSLTKPMLWHSVEREKYHGMEISYADTIKPFGFMSVAFRADDSDSWYSSIQQINSTPIPKYFCRKHRVFASGNCSNKAYCKYATKCLAGVTPSPVAPFINDTRDWNKVNWFDRITRQTINVHPVLSLENGISGDKAPELESTSEIQGMYIKTYRMVIDEYGYHPEEKYDNEQGKECRPATSGQLYPTLVKPVQIRVQGKETNTLYLLEEDENLVAGDERKSHLEIMDYTSFQHTLFDESVWKLVLERLQTCDNKKQLGKQLQENGLGSYREICYWLNGESKPSTQTLYQLVEFLDIQIPQSGMIQHSNPKTEDKKPKTEENKNNGKLLDVWNKVLEKMKNTNGKRKLGDKLREQGLGTYNTLKRWLNGSTIPNESKILALADFFKIKIQQPAIEENNIKEEINSKVLGTTPKPSQFLTDEKTVYLPIDLKFPPKYMDRLRNQYPNCFIKLYGVEYVHLHENAMKLVKQLQTDYKTELLENRLKILKSGLLDGVNLTKKGQHTPLSIQDITEIWTESTVGTKGKHLMVKTKNDEMLMIYKKHSNNELFVKAGLLPEPKDLPDEVVKKILNKSNKKTIMYTKRMKFKKWKGTISRHSIVALYGIKKKLLDTSGIKPNEDGLYDAKQVLKVALKVDAENDLAM